MAAAAYNAGPHRVRAWRPAACMPEDIWIENIPFTETRRYVRRTLFFATVYEWRLTQNITTLASRSTGIPGKTGASTC
jgi:soluble lytic murein transglycosylase